VKCSKLLPHTQTHCGAAHRTKIEMSPGDGWMAIKSNVATLPTVNLSSQLLHSLNHTFS